MLNSYYQSLGAVEFPVFANRQLYMHSFDVANPSAPEGFEDYLPMIDKLLKQANYTKGTAHFTVDEKVVKAGMSQRRPGPHVDGCFIPKAMDWSHGGGGGWNHYCNHLMFYTQLSIA